MQKLFYILVCDDTNSYANPVLLGTYSITDAQHILFLDRLVSTTFPSLFGTYYILYFLAYECSYITWHMNIFESLSTYYIVTCSAPTVA